MRPGLMAGKGDAPRPPRSVFFTNRLASQTLFRSLVKNAKDGRASAIFFTCETQRYKLILGPIQDMRIFAIMVCVLLCREVHCQGLFLSSIFSTFSETRTARVYGNAAEERESKTINSSLGVKVGYIHNRLKFGIGSSYVNRKYDMRRPFNHCYFNEPGVYCTFILAHVDGYNYRTLEVPASMDFIVFRTKRWNFCVGATYASAFILKSEYHSLIPAMGSFEDKQERDLFSRSMIGQIGICYELTSRVYLNAQPFGRISHSQRGDLVLFESAATWMKTQFDSFGVNVELLYRFSRGRNL